MSVSKRSLSTVCINAIDYDVISRVHSVVGNPGRVNLSGCVAYQESAHARNADFLYLLMPLEILLTDLSLMNIQSTPFHTESSCQISSSYAKTFDITSCLQNSGKNRTRNLTAEQSHMVARPLTAPMPLKSTA
jgi:hypothetical protein